MANFFDVDRNRLDEEWATFPKTYYEYAEKLADARAAHERAKTEEEIVEAELDRRIRMMPEKYGLEKVTEPAVEKTIILQTRFQDARRARIDAKHKLDVIQAAVDTLDAKKYGLQDLTKLQLNAYYANAQPKDPEVRRFAGRAEEDRAFRQRTKKE